ncbi:hypothetical protein ACHAP5_006259 [Fusarium lateritium]
MWLARDLMYVVHRELPIYKVMSLILEKTKNPGRNNIRRLLGSFEIDGPDGRRAVLVIQPAQMSLRDFKSVFRKDGFDEAFVQGTIQELLKALDFVHNEAQLVHTDIHPGNLLLGLDDDSQL